MTSAASFLILCGIGVLCLLSYNLVRMPALALFAESLGAGPETIGLVVSVSTLTGVLLKLPAGTLSDIYGRRVLMGVGILAFSLPPFAYPFVSDLEVLTELRAVHGLATAIFGPTSLATVAEMYPERRGAALGWYTASTQAGALLGPVLGGWLVYTVDFPRTFLSAGVFGCLGLLLFFTLQFQTSPQRSRDRQLWPALAVMWRGFLTVARNGRVLMTSATDGAKMIANGALMAFLPLYGVSVGLNPGEVGLLFGMQGITSFLSKPAMGRLSDKVGRRPLILLGLLICAGTFVLMPRVSGLMLLLGLSAGFGFGEAVVTSSTSALVADLSESGAIGTGMGMQGTISDIGHASGPLLAGILIAQLGYQGAFTIIASMQLVAAALFWVIMRK
ncbi:MAG: MFS transporter [bacterium]